MTQVVPRPMAVPGRPLPPGRAGAYFTALADLHLPVTAVLAEGLARMETAQDPGLSTPWGAAWGLAGAAIGLPGRFGRRPTWQREVPVFARLVASPVLRQVAFQVGEVAIDVPGLEGVAQDQGTSDAAIHAQVARLLGSEAAMGAAFWAAAGTGLLAAFRHRAAVARTARRSPPSIDAELALFVHTIEPERGGHDPALRRLKAIARSERLRSGIRPREGGVVGVLQTRRVEDVGEAMISTFVHPRPLLLQKLLEEGFPIPHRPPLRRPRRDMMVLCQASDPTGTPTRVVKAAWIDATLRLGLLLRAAGLPHSEFAWVDRHDGGTVAAGHSASPGAPGPRTGAGARALDGGRLAGLARRATLAGSGLATDAFLRFPPLSDGPTQAPDARGAVTAGIATCLRAAAETGGPATMRARDRSLPTGPEDYGAHLVQSVEPAQVAGGTRVGNWRRDRAPLTGLLRGQPATRAMLVLVPETLSPGAGFTIYSDLTPDGEIIVVDPDGTVAEVLPRVIGALSDRFLAEVMEALHG